MYPTLTDFIQDIFGVYIPLPIQSYGFMVAMAFLAGALILILEFRRKEKLGQLVAIKKEIIIGEAPKMQDVIISLVIGFLLGYKLIEAVFHYADFVDNPQDFITSGRGNFWGGLIFGVASAVWTFYEQKKKQLPKPKTEIHLIHPYELTGNIIVLGAIFGILGSKLFDTFDHIEDLINDPIGTIFSFSGLSFLGGLLVAGAAIIIYARKNQIKVLHLADVTAPALALAYAVGRVGCQVSGDGCWGVENVHPMPQWLSWLPEWVWSYDYPHNVINEGVRMAGEVGKHTHVLEHPVFPTPLYETTMMLVVFVILWSLRKRIAIPGVLFAIYFSLAGLERFLIEKIRINVPYNLFGFEATQAEIIAFLMIIAGLVSIYLLIKNKQKLANY
jgi:prolipoprotein diacylglyceryl transferase